MKQRLSRTAAAMLIRMLVATLMLLSAASSSASEPELPVGIGEDEYAVYNAALKDLTGVFDIHVDTRAVFNATLPMRRLDVDEIRHLVRSDMPFDPALIDDFNQRNDRSWRIEPGQLQPPLRLVDNWDPEFPSLGAERLELSRVGFDRQRRHALLLVSYTYLTKFRAFYSSGSYLLLEAGESGWTVTRKAAAWVRYY